MPNRRASDVIAALAKGRMSVERAAEALRLEVTAQSLPLAEVTRLIDAAVTEGGLQPETAQLLRGILTGATLARSGGRTDESIASDVTQLRHAESPPPETAGTMVRRAGDDSQAAAPTAARAPIRDERPAFGPDTLASDSKRSATAVHENRPESGLSITDLVGDASVGSADTAPSAALGAGSLLKDRFRLESQIGRGGMGLVFSAIDRRKEEARDPNPRVAVKILSADFERHPESFIALQREARKAQTLAHPNVVTVFDFDRDGRRVFMTMELLRGRSLEAVIRRAQGRGLERKEALPIIRGIAEGLAYAHRKGIVHSDLKPGNVFLLEDGTPKILDFGIARAVPALGGEVDEAFDAGSLGAYTEAYATTEMVEGAEPHPADDVYALGVIAYELLTGSHPYGQNSVPRARELQLRPAAVHQLKRREWKVLERCLALDRAARPPSAGEFVKQFFGVTPLQKSLVAASVLMAFVAAYFWYANLQETRPVVPFESLPAETQQSFDALIAQGRQEWEFFERDGNMYALSSALDSFAEAYDLHPRNPRAVEGLQEVADAFLTATADDPERRAQAIELLQQKSEYLAKYRPLVKAREATSGP